MAYDKGLQMSYLCFRTNSSSLFHKDILDGPKWEPANEGIIRLRFKALIRLAHNDQTAANFHQLRKVAASLAFDKGLSIAELGYV